MGYGIGWNGGNSENVGTAHTTTLNVEVIAAAAVKYQVFIKYYEPFSGV